MSGNNVKVEAGQEIEEGKSQVGITWDLSVAMVSEEREEVQIGVGAARRRERERRAASLVLGL